MTDRDHIRATYAHRQASFAEQASTLRRRYQQLGLVRLVVFLVGLGVLVLIFAQHWLAGTVGLLALGTGFFRLVRWHQRLQTQATFQENLAQINAAEQEALDYRFSKRPDGTEFSDLTHPYAMDLDLFGPHSLFQWINRAQTQIGRHELANWLTHPLTPTEIARRQEAITELRPLLDWRQQLTASGMEAEDNPQQLQRLYDWLNAPADIPPSSKLSFLLILMPVLTISAVAATLPYYPWYVVALCILPNVLLLRPFRKKIDHIHQQTTQAGKTLDHYARILAQIAHAPDFSASLNGDMRRRISEEAVPAIRTLQYRISQLDVRHNIFAIFLNLLGLWDLQWAYRLEQWKSRQQDNLPDWLEVLRAFEALSSLANLWYNNPDWTLPTVHQKARLSGLQIGHPLIPPEKRVCNDLDMPTRGHIKLITGSNMAGKSTFLRTAGLNIVLATIGAPVCAQSLKLPILQVYTSMRTQDALHESTSSFYAELKRLKLIIQAVEAGEPVFFLLDEILKGTNSRDRHTGAKALIQQLIDQAGAGLIATHDLELGTLEAESAGAVENLCMEVQIKDGRLEFDYTLKKGVSQSFNATLLMQKMGIRIPERHDRL